MIFKDDIHARIIADFEEDANEAMSVLIEAVNKTDCLKTDRVIRCIIFLAKGNLHELNKYIEVATFDTRDVMLSAEYEKLNGDFNYKRKRDFNKTFEECSDAVKE